jgi:hypothetical protein
MSSLHLLEKLQKQALSDDLERQGGGRRGSAQIGHLGAHLFQDAAQAEDDLKVGLSTCAKVTTVLATIVYVAICAFLGFLHQLNLALTVFDDDCGHKVSAAVWRLQIAGLVLIWGGGIVVGIYCCVLPFKVRHKGGKFTCRHLLLLLPVLAQVASVVILLVLGFRQPDCGNLSA